MTDQYVPKLRQRFLEDMRIKGLQPKTQTMYLRAMREFDPINNNPDPADVLSTPVDKVVDPMTFQAQRTVVPLFEKPVPSMQGKAIARGCGLWFSDTVAHTLGVLLGLYGISALSQPKAEVRQAEHAGGVQ